MTPDVAAHHWHEHLMRWSSLWTALSNVGEVLAPLGPAWRFGARLVEDCPPASPTAALRAVAVRTTAVQCVPHPLRSFCASSVGFAVVGRAGRQPVHRPAVRRTAGQRCADRGVRPQVTPHSHGHHPCPLARVPRALGCASGCCARCRQGPRSSRLGAREGCQTRVDGSRPETARLRPAQALQLIPPRVHQVGGRAYQPRRQCHGGVAPDVPAAAEGANCGGRARPLPQRRRAATGSGTC